MDWVLVEKLGQVVERGYLEMMRRVVEKYPEDRISGNKHYWGGNLSRDRLPPQ